MPNPAVAPTPGASESALPRPSKAWVTTTTSTTAPSASSTGTPVGPSSAPAIAAAIAATTDAPRVSRSASRECSMRMPNAARHTAPTAMTTVMVSNTGESARPMSGPSAITPPARRRTPPDRFGDFGVPRSDRRAFWRAQIPGASTHSALSEKVISHRFSAATAPIRGVAGIGQSYGRASSARPRPDHGTRDQELGHRLRDRGFGLGTDRRLREVEERAARGLVVPRQGQGVEEVERLGEAAAARARPGGWSRWARRRPARVARPARSPPPGASRPAGAR